IQDPRTKDPIRPTVFYRGYDVFDQAKVGFVSDVSRFDDEGCSKDEPENPRKYFRLDTQVKPGGATPHKCRPRRIGIWNNAFCPGERRNRGISENILINIRATNQ
ncbi:MAG: hypothetical protein DMF02_03585, partial [Verrucomicrobia bacterium]